MTTKKHKPRRLTVEQMADKYALSRESGFARFVARRAFLAGFRVGQRRNRRAKR